MDGSVVAYAPANGPSLEPASATQSTLYVVGKLADNGDPIGDGLVWRVFRDFPDANGELPLVHKGRGGDLELRVKPGRYIVHVAYGRAAVSRVVNVRGSATSETFVLNAGGLQLNAEVDGVDTVDRKNPAKFEVYSLRNGERQLVGNVRAGAIARLSAGNYHVISKYGNVNAVRTADVLVEAGKLTRVSLRHKAGEISLKLVRNTGGEAIADTAWTVYNGEGEEVFERVGAHANVTLAAGDYAVVAKHRDTEFRQSFTVSSGKASAVTVVAKQLSSPL
ncbi:hypothetical protein RDV64_02615 [Acuticoccus sp. MNP-M23]|uniref:hypothetical protein n=1 Tax=Acuticoccus sp. MNP-M23 TaxID=3072793 RepID=UPI002815EC59|nr:hypothetical protein [Acuticoccus sp. MNP-M23]WMS43315.1 hypothetical protein RDV64_02615 [Acuticoccus sp. MNP-M23]